MIDGLNVSNWENNAVFEHLRAGNLTAINATVATWENFVQTMARLAGWMWRFRERDDVLQVKETADIHAAKKLGKTGIMLGFQNASPIENELDRLGCSSHSECGSSNPRITRPICWAAATGSATKAA